MCSTWVQDFPNIAKNDRCFDLFIKETQNKITNGDSPWYKYSYMLFNLFNITMRFFLEAKYLKIKKNTGKTINTELPTNRTNKMT